VRLHAAPLGVPDLNRDAGIGELLDRVVGHRLHQDVDLDFVVRIEAEAPGADGVLH
jgi:hypothetical protein